MSVVQVRFTPDRGVFPTCYESAARVNGVFRGTANGLRKRSQAAAAACVIATRREMARRYFLR
jgi:hypothetical protein